jgi:hypothetical protein
LSEKGQGSVPVNEGSGSTRTASGWSAPPGTGLAAVGPEGAGPTGSGPGSGGPGIAITPQPPAGSMAGATGTGSIDRSLTLPSGTRLVEMSDGRRLAQRSDGSNIPVDNLGVFTDPVTGNPVSMTYLSWSPEDFRQTARDLELEASKALNAGDPARAQSLKSEADWNRQQAAAIEAGYSSSDAGPIR